MEFLDALAPMRAVAVEQSVFLRISRKVMLEFMQEGFPITLHIIRGVQAAVGWLVQEIEKAQS